MKVFLIPTLTRIVDVGPTVKILDENEWGIKVEQVNRHVFKISWLFWKYQQIWDMDPVVFLKEKPFPIKLF